MIKSKQDIKDDIQERKKELNSYEDQGCYNASWCAGYIHAMKEILASWNGLYRGQKFDSAVEDAKAHLRDFFSNEVCLTDEECDKRVAKAVENGTVDVIAERFLDNHDCNIAENDQYYGIIQDMYRNKETDDFEDE